MGGPARCRRFLSRRAGRARPAGNTGQADGPQASLPTLRAALDVRPAAAPRRAPRAAPTLHGPVHPAGSAFLLGCLGSHRCSARAIRPTLLRVSLAHIFVRRVCGHQRHGHAVGSEKTRNFALGRAHARAHARDTFMVRVPGRQRSRRLLASHSCSCPEQSTSLRPPMTHCHGPMGRDMGRCA